MRKGSVLVLVLVSVLCVALGGAGFEVTLSLDGAMVRMSYLNGQVKMLAERQDAEYTPLWLGTEAQVAIWPWPFLGVVGSWTGSFGAIRGRVREPITATALGGALCGRIEMRPLGFPMGIEMGVGGYSAGVSGLVSGQGFGWGGHLAVGGTLLSAGTLSVEVHLRLRYLPVRSIASGREIVAPEDAPAVDFTGLGIGITIAWKG